MPRLLKASLSMNSSMGQSLMNVVPHDELTFQKHYPGHVKTLGDNVDLNRSMEYLQKSSWHQAGTQQIL